MDIVCSIDNNYVQHCCVMLSSLLANNKWEKHRVHLLSEGLSIDNINLIDKLVSSHNSELHYYQLTSEKLKQCPIKETDHLSIATYYRLFMTDILPSNIDKVLYLDSDIVVARSIQELWNTDINGKALAAVEEMGCSLPDVFDRLQFDKEYGYFNAGVLLINLAYWRDNNITALFSDYIINHSDQIVAHDQDVLNALFHDKYLKLSFEWNVEEAFYHYSFLKRNKFDRQILRILYNPAILHYTWKPKPWDASCRHPYRFEYFDYLKTTQFYSQEPKSVLQKRKKDLLLFKLLTTLRIRKRAWYKLK